MIKKMNPDSALLRGFLATGASVFALGATAPVLAQGDEDDVATIAEIEEDIEDARTGDQIIVTGSRVRRNEFTSASPLQVIDGQVSRELGVFDTARLLQESAVATGQQINDTFGGFVLDNGPGASTVALRGIDPERTLLLLNGRRLAPGGVEGAPTSPDLNLIPSSLIGRVDVLLDGASPVYGSDAVAGVANVILRDDFDGFEIETAFNVPFTGGGKTSQVSASWGVSNDRGFIGVGAEFFRRDQFSVADADLTCNEHHQEDENGNIRNIEVDVQPGTSRQPCKTQIIGRFRTFGIDDNFGGSGTSFGDLFYTPGTSNVGVPNFSDEIDADGDGFLDIDSRAPIFTGADQSRSLVQNQDLISPLERISFMAFGNYELEELNNMETFFEFMYAERDSKITGDGAQIFPTVLTTNPTNPCGLEALAADPTLCGGGPQQVVPIVLIDGDRNTTQVEQTQIRIVGGIRGDLPFWNEDPGDGLFGLSNWNYELSGSFSRSLGTSVRRGIIEDRLALSLRTTTRLPDGTLGCGPDFNGDGLPDLANDAELFGFLTDNPCVPVNLFSANVMQGNVLTPEEEEYLFGVRTFGTEIKQSIISGFLSGGVMNVPAGEVLLGLGFEYRQDEIDSRPDDNAEDGNFIGFFADRGAVGRRELKEGYGELIVPIFRDQPFAQELTVEAAGRVTNESFYGTNWTYAVKGIYMPFDWLTIRGSRGTSFRAPNLREQFFRGATGFQSAFADVCTVPPAANNGGVYDAANDPRSARVLANCVLDGVDPTALGLMGASSIEVLTGGTTLLEAETSRTFTVGGVLDVPFADMGLGDNIGLNLSVTHFDIRVENTVEEPSVTFLFNDCYDSRDDLSSAFCNRITRDPNTGFVDIVDAGFINIGVITSRGMDYNVLFEYDGFTVANEPLELSLDVRATQLFEQTQTVIDTFDDNVGEFGTPTWRGQATLLADLADWRFLWRARYIGSQSVFSSVDDGDPPAFGADDTCQAVLDITGARDTSDVGCRPTFSVDDYIVNDASITWRNDVWSATVGINNVFDRKPPRVDSTNNFTSGLLVSPAGNYPLGVGYDFLGRSFQVSVQRKF